MNETRYCVYKCVEDARVNLTGLWLKKVLVGPHPDKTCSCTDIGVYVQPTDDMTSLFRCCAGGRRRKHVRMSVVSLAFRHNLNCVLRVIIGLKRREPNIAINWKGILAARAFPVITPQTWTETRLDIALKIWEKSPQGFRQTSPKVVETRCLFLWLKQRGLLTTYPDRFRLFLKL